MAADETRTPQPNKTVANTYRLYSKNPFHVETVEKIMRTVFLGVFEQPDFVYEPNVCSKLACDLAQDIKEQVKALNYDRYKLVSLVTIGERKYQYQYATLKFLWDAERDKYALCQFMDNPKFYAIGLVIAVYYD